MVDREDDVKLGLRTSAIFFGAYDVFAVMLCYAIFLVTLALVGVFWAYGKYYYLGLLAAAGIAAYHYVLIRGRTREGCFKAFRHNNWIGLVIFLGIFLRSTNAPMTNFTFEDTLTQIGLGYLFLFALGHVRLMWQWLALILILIGYWALFALWLLPGPEFDFKAVNGLSEAERPTGFAAHWDKNTNPAWEFDKWFLNQFPRPKPFTHNRGGYATLSFIPTLGTMILGLITGRWLRKAAPKIPMKKLLVAG